jgi:hypothetical protein
MRKLAFFLCKGSEQCFRSPLDFCAAEPALSGRIDELSYIVKETRQLIGFSSFEYG